MEGEYFTPDGVGVKGLKGLSDEWKLQASLQWLACILAKETP